MGSLLMTTGLAVALVAAVSAAEKKRDQRPDLSGSWSVVADQTDDASKAAQVFTGPGGGEGRDPGLGPMGGGMGRRPGGWGGGRGGGRGPGGFGRGGGGGFGGGSFTPPSPEERAAMHEAVRAALEAPAAIKIIASDAEISIERPDGDTRRFSTDGKKSEALGVARSARWKNGKLVVETKARRVKITETWGLGPEPGQLAVDVRAEDPRFDGKLNLKRLYTRAVEPQPTPQP
jgi:hypothetical protein